MTLSEAIEEAIERWKGVTFADMMVNICGIPEDMIDRDTINEQASKLASSYDVSKFQKPAKQEQVNEFNRKYFFDSSGQLWKKPTNDR